MGQPLFRVELVPVPLQFLQTTQIVKRFDSGDGSRANKKSVERERLAKGSGKILGFRQAAQRMITESEVIPLLLVACPGFQSAWEKHLAYWNGDVTGAFIDAGEFAHYIVACYERNDTSEFAAAFAAIEKVLNEGDQKARDIAGIGVLEDIQTIASHSCGGDVFVQWLGPASRVAWAQIAKMWERKASLMDVIRAEH